MSLQHVPKPKPLITLITIHCFIVTILLASHIDAVVVDDTTTTTSSSSNTNINLITDALEYDWPPALYDEYEDDDDVLVLGRGGMEEMSGESRRSLYWRRLRRYYISYGVLFANRIPCPPRSGRSYYTHNCHKATAPAHPYTRGCSAITRCRS